MGVFSVPASGWGEEPALALSEERAACWGGALRGSFKLLLYLIVNQATPLVVGMGKRESGKLQEWS